MKQLYSKHFGRAVVYTLLALFLCVAGAGKAAAAEEFTYKPQVKVISTNYTNSGTEVTLKLWMHNFAGGLHASLMVGMLTYILTTNNHLYSILCGQR